MTGLELIPLCSVFMRIEETIVLENTPSGTLMIGELVDSVWEGERFKLTQKGRASADWLMRTPDGRAAPDIRLTLESEEGGLVFVEYSGRLNPETGIAYTCPRFTTGAPGLEWLNHVQAVGKAFFDPEAMTVTYPEVFELR
ncbi:MAG: DUF3237 family protein [Deltaproteobacteria bacterium]|nr:DUF3237 family protein [Deltaproteobacteria bacterium]